jgi:hypothetical protein
MVYIRARGTQTVRPQSTAAKVKINVKAMASKVWLQKPVWIRAASSLTSSPSHNFLIIGK